MKTASRFITPCIRAILKMLCRVDSAELDKVPAQGPLIIVINHINFLEVPMIYSFLYPREVIGLLKAETWKEPFIRELATVWSAIPITRGSTDMNAMRLSFKALRCGRYLAIAPEGTRSHDGRLRQGHAGAVFIAEKSGVPILPIVHYGGENFWDNLRHLRKTQFHFRVGKPLRIVAPEGGLSREQRAAYAEEIMRGMASLLPERYRGRYADINTI